MPNLAAMDLVELFRRELELCKVEAGEKLVVLAEPASRSEYVEAAFAAGLALGAHVIQAVLPGGSPVPLPSSRTGSGAGLTALDDNPLALQLLQGADMVLDLTNEGFIHTTSLGEILRAGTRMLFVADPPEVLARNLPEAGDKLRVQRGADLLRAGRQLHVTSPSGTDLVADLTDAHPGFQCGIADDPGRWDHWPSTMVLAWPKTSTGRIVIGPGDILLPFKTYVRDEVTLTVEDGRIADIAGAGGDARLLEMFFADAGDDEARFLSHMGWGLMKNADWFSMALYDRESLMGMDARGLAGNFLFSTGPHPFMDRHTHNHLDIPLRGCTVAIDGRAVVESGVLVESEEG
jgi:2,5-dihydroxypyridine 5,6-dioxygenase